MFSCMAPWNIGIKQPWEQCLELAVAGGFEGIDPVLDATRGGDYYREQYNKWGLKVGGTSLPVDFRGEEQQYERQLAALPAFADLARQVGISRVYMWVMSFHDTMDYATNLAFHVERLTPCARVLCDHGIRLGLEFLGPRSLRVGHRYPFIRTMEQMLDMCRMIGPNCGLLLDLWHWYTSLGTVQDIEALTNGQVVYVHVNDAPAAVNVDQQADQVRCLPGSTGVIDTAGFMGALRKIGYDGPLVPEPFDRQLSQMPPQEAARMAGESMRKILQ